MCLSNEGEIYGFGNNKKGRIGVDEDFVSIPKKVKNLINIVRVTCGDWHSLALDSSGNVFSTGGNNSGALGLNSSVNNIYNFTKIETMTNITQISAGRFLTFPQ